MRISLTLLLFCTFLVQCSKDDHTEHIQLLDEISEHILEVENLTVFPGDSEPRYSIALFPVQTYGETGEPYLTRVIQAVVADNDRVIILNVSSSHREHHVYVFNPDGSYLTQIGRAGSGPGEFVMAGIPEVKNGKVLFIDISNQRLNVYNTKDYSFEYTSLLDDWSVRYHEAVHDMRFSYYIPRNDGNLLARFREIVPTSGSRLNNKFILIDLDGNVLDPKPLEFTGGFSFSTNTNPPRPSLLSPQFMGSTIFALSDDDALYTMWTRDFLIKKYDANGVYQSAIYYPITGSQFDIEDYNGMLGFTRHNLISSIKNSDENMPETNPVVATFKIDDEDRIWVAVPKDKQREFYEWWILAPSGELLAKLQHPSDQTIYDIKNGYLYSKGIDKDTDAEYVVKYRIEFEEIR